MQNKSTQTGECVITAEDLTSDEPSADYWRQLAETRGDALNRSIQENEKLKEDIEVLQEENKICKEMLEESKNLVEVLQVVIFYILFTMPSIPMELTYNAYYHILFLNFSIYRLFCLFSGNAE